jgi:hypothetical protein
VKIRLRGPILSRHAQLQTAALHRLLRADLPLPTRRVCGVRDYCWYMIKALLNRRVTREDLETEDGTRRHEESFQTALSIARRGSFRTNHSREMARRTLHTTRTIRVSRRIVRRVDT